MRGVGLEGEGAAGRAVMLHTTHMHTIGAMGMQAPTSVTLICTRRGLEKSNDGVCSCAGR